MTTHGERNSILMRTNRYLQIRKHYLQLYDLSRTIRYLAKPANWTPANVIMAEVIKKLLYPIENSVQKLLKTQYDLPEINLQAELGQPPISQSGQP